MCNIEWVGWGGGCLYMKCCHLLNDESFYRTFYSDSEWTLTLLLAVQQYTLQENTREHAGFILALVQSMHFCTGFPSTFQTFGM